MIAALALIIWAAWYYGFFSPVTIEEIEESVQQPVSEKDTTADIGSDLNSVDIGDPNQDLKQMDADIDSL